MADTYVGAPSAAQIITYMDALASQFKGVYSTLGLGASTETTTNAALAKSARAKILGDGATFYGIGNAQLQATVKDTLATLAAASRYDSFFATYCRSLITQLESSVQANLPSGWSFTSSTQTHVLDSHLLRLNAMNSTVPTTPASAGVLTATTVTGGGIASSVAGSAPRVVHTLVSSSGQWYESLGSPEATQVAVAGGQNAYTYQIAGNVPTGVAYVNIYRGYTGGAGGTYYYDQQVAVTAGSAYPAITIKQPDGLLRVDWTPPSWGSCLMTPEAAAIFALAFSTQTLTQGAALNPLAFSSSGMLTPNNVALTPSSGFLGIGNQSQNGQFGADVVGGSYTQGTLSTANSYAQDVQGFVGAYGANCLQARVTSPLNAAGTVAMTYSYYAAATGYGSAQSVTSAAATFGGTANGSTAVITIPAGRLVYAVTAVTNASMVSGNYLIESAANTPRTY